MTQSWQDKSKTQKSHATASQGLVDPSRASVSTAGSPECSSLVNDTTRHSISESGTERFSEPMDVPTDLFQEPEFEPELKTVDKSQSDASFPNQKCESETADCGYSGASSESKVENKVKMAEVSNTIIEKTEENVQPNVNGVQAQDEDFEEDDLSSLSMSSLNFAFSMP